MISAIGNITGNLTAGNISSLGALAVTSNLTAGNANISGTIISVSGNITGNLTAGNISSLGALAVTGNLTAGNASISGTMISAIGNITGNLTAGNISSLGAASVTGNLTAGNISTGFGNLSTGNISTSGLVTVTGNLSAGNLITTGIANITGTLTGSFINLYATNPGVAMYSLNSSDYNGTLYFNNIVSQITKYYDQIYSTNGLNSTNTGLTLFTPSSSRSIYMNVEYTNIVTVNSTGLLCSGDANITGNISISGVANITGNTTVSNIIATSVIASSSITLNGITVPVYYYQTGTFTPTASTNSTIQAITPFTYTGNLPVMFGSNGDYLANPNFYVIGCTPMYNGGTINGTVNQVRIWYTSASTALCRYTVCAIYTP